MIDRRLDVNLRPEVPLPYPYFSESCETVADDNMMMMMDAPVACTYPNVFYNSERAEVGDFSSTNDWHSSHYDDDLVGSNLLCNNAVDPDTYLCHPNQQQCTCPTTPSQYDEGCGFADDEFLTGCCPSTANFETNSAMDNFSDATCHQNANAFELPFTSYFSCGVTNGDNASAAQVTNNDQATCVDPSESTRAPLTIQTNVFSDLHPNSTFGQDVCTPNMNEDPLCSTDNANQDLLALLDELITDTGPAMNCPETTSTCAVASTSGQHSTPLAGTTSVTKLVRTVSYERKRSQNNKACRDSRRKRKMEQNKAELKVLELTADNELMKKQIKQLENEVQYARATVMAQIRNRSRV